MKVRFTVNLESVSVEITEREVQKLFDGAIKARRQYKNAEYDALDVYDSIMRRLTENQKLAAEYRELPQGD